MKYKRYFRDAGILALFCIGFFLITKSIDLLGEDKQEPVQVEFSEARRMADRNVNRRDFTAAVRFLTELTEEDEFNSHAWSRLGDCYANLYEQSKRPSLADPTPYSEDSRLKQKELADKAIAAYEHVIDFPRYRINAIQRIAVLHILEGNNDAALDILESAVEFKSEISNPHFIQREPFVVLAGDPRYEALKKVLPPEQRRDNRYRRADRSWFDVGGSTDSSPDESGGKN
jgi:tetratricopeptide (TPR) repeat protein